LQCLLFQPNFLAIRLLSACDVGRCIPIPKHVRCARPSVPLPFSDFLLFLNSGPASPLKVILPEEYAATPAKDAGKAAAPPHGGLPPSASLLSMPASPLRFSPSLFASPRVTKQSSPDRWLNHVQFHFSVLCSCCLASIHATKTALSLTALLRICQALPACLRAIPGYLAA
jgi:hypothetical protein